MILKRRDGAAGILKMKMLFLSARWPFKKKADVKGELLCRVLSVLVYFSLMYNRIAELARSSTQ